MIAKLIFVLAIASAYAYNQPTYSRQPQKTHSTFQQVQGAGYGAVEETREEVAPAYEAKPAEPEAPLQQQQQQSASYGGYEPKQPMQAPLRQYPVRKEEPKANIDYTVSWNVKDDLSANFQTREEEKYGNKVKGQYTVVEPTGELRVVKYYADETGFHADVQKQPAPSGYKQSYQPQQLPAYNAPQKMFVPIPLRQQEQHMTKEHTEQTAAGY